MLQGVCKKNVDRHMYPPCKGNKTWGIRRQPPTTPTLTGVHRLRTHGVCSAGPYPPLWKDTDYPPLGSPHSPVKALKGEQEQETTRARTTTARQRYSSKTEK
eukprot:428534-Hanusia_phi.AAC.1